MSVKSTFYENTLRKEVLIFQWDAFNFRPISPVRTMTTSTEKYVSTGRSGEPSAIPGLEFIDSELQNVSPIFSVLLSILYNTEQNSMEAL